MALRIVPQVASAKPRRTSTATDSWKDRDQQHHARDGARADRGEQDTESLGTRAEDVARKDRDERLVVAEDRKRRLDPENERKDGARPHIAEAAYEILP